MREGDEEKFRSALHCAGMAVQAERYDVMLAAYRDFQALMACLDEPFAYVKEPACTLQLLPLVTR